MLRTTVGKSGTVFFTPHFLQGITHSPNSGSADGTMAPWRIVGSIQFRAYFSGICETNQAMIEMKMIVRTAMTNTTRPGLRPFDSVSPASARPSGRRHPSESYRKTPAERAAAPLSDGAGTAARLRFRSLNGPPLTAWRRRRLLLFIFLFRVTAI